MRERIYFAIRYLIHSLSKMKPVERDKTKAGCEQKHPYPDNYGKDNHERHITGNINARGIIEVERGPDLKQQHATERKDDKTYNDKVLAVNALTLIAVVIYAGLTWWQGCSSSRSATAAQRAADTAFGTLTSSRQQFRTEQRPWIAAEAVPIGPDQKPFQPVSYPNGLHYRIAINVYGSNTGKTPAVKVIASKVLYLVGPAREATSKAQQFVPKYPNVGGVFFAPNSGPSAIWIDHENDLTQSQYESLNDGTWSLFIVGGIRYRDVFAPQTEPYETIYCFQYNRVGLPIGTCPFTNDLK